MNFDAAALAYVRYVLEEKQLKPGALALKAGISASTLTRALNDPNHKFKLSMTTLEKIADASGISPAPFLQAKDTAELTLSEAHRPEIYRPGERPPPKGLHDAGYNFTFIIGDIAAGKWIDPGPFDYMGYGPIHLTHTIKSSKECFAYVVRDDSADMIATQDDLLFCTKVDEQAVEDFIAKTPWSESYGSGPVVVERRSRDAFKVEHTARLIRRRRDGVAGWELVSAHEEDNFPKDKTKKKPPLIPRVFIDRYGGNDEIRVIGTVEAVLRDSTDVMNWLLMDLP